MRQPSPKRHVHAGLTRHGNCCGHAVAAISFLGGMRKPIIAPACGNLTVMARPARTVHEPRRSGTLLLFLWTRTGTRCTSKRHSDVTRLTQTPNPLREPRLTLVPTPDLSPPCDPYTLPERHQGLNPCSSFRDAHVSYLPWRVRHPSPPPPLHSGSMHGTPGRRRPRFRRGARTDGAARVGGIGTSSKDVA